MALRRIMGSRRGVSAGTKVAATKVSYTVVKEITNAMKIAGKRRQKGDVFEAVPRHVHFLELEGVIARTATSSSSSSSTSSSSSASSASSSSSATSSSSSSSTSSASSASSSSSTSSTSSASSSSSASSAS